MQPSPSPQANLHLTTDQRDHIARLLAKQRYCLTPAGREMIRGEAGLGAFRTRLDFATDARTFASQLAGVLHEQGSDPTTGEPALLPLRCWLREEVAGQKEETAYLEELISYRFGAAFSGQRATELALLERRRDLKHFDTSDVFTMLSGHALG